MSGITILRYAGQPPSNEFISAELKLAEQSYTYVVGTAAQARLRQALAPSHQVNVDGSHMVFHKVLRHLMNTNLLTRTQQHVVLQRAAKNVAQDPVMELQLKHDVFAWQKALQELSERDTDLAESIPPELQDRLVNASLGSILQALQREVRRVQQEYEMPTFEQAAHDFLRSRFTPTPTIIMEGFTFLTPLQARLIDVCTEKGCTIYIIHAFNEDQRYGFAIMDRTFTRWLTTATTRMLEVPSSQSASDLEHLQAALFTGRTTASYTNDRSVTLTEFRHRQHEISECIEMIATYLSSSEPVPLKQIAIVSRNPREFQSQLQEVADLRNLHDAEGNEISFGIQPRHLLLTPVGRFILTLYEIWVDGELDMNADQFEELLASGWLGGSRQSTVLKFALVRDQIFAQARSKNDWLTLFQQLREIPARTDSRLPSASMSSREGQDGNVTLELWEEAIAQIEELCARLFGVGMQSIGSHIEVLRNVLNTLAPEDIRAKELEVVERIRDVMSELASQDSIPISTAEFGGILNRLVQEYETPAVPEESTEPPTTAGQLWITTPESIDSYPADVVFYLGADDHRVPRQYAEPWPFFSVDVDEHQEKERYLFLAVVRAARKHLHLSFACTDEKEEIYGPSPYLREVAACLDRPIEVAPLPAQNTSIVEESLPHREPLPRARRDTYTLSEITQFALCPFRYKLENLNRRAWHYPTTYQLRFFAQAVWLDLIFQHLEESQEGAAGEDDILRLLLGAQNATEVQVKRVFPGFRDLDWVIVEHRVRRVLRDDAVEYSSRGGRMTAVEAPASYYSVNEGDRTIRVDARMHHATQHQRGQYLNVWTYTGDVLREEWLLPAKWRARLVAPTVEIDGVRVFVNKYEALVVWWRDLVIKAHKFHTSQGQNNTFAQTAAADYAAGQQEIASWLPVIEAGNYPKHTGEEHCRLCPVYGHCLGMREENS